MDKPLWGWTDRGAREEPTIKYWDGTKWVYKKPKKQDPYR